MKYLIPDYVYTAEGLQKQKAIAIDDDGRITAIVDRESQAVVEDMLRGTYPLEELPDVVLIPGFVNAHSHIFQRALRGHTHRMLSSQDNFWTWRDAMYAEAQRLTPDSLYILALDAYQEMLAAGYTTVGEFHYVHHQLDGTPYTQPNEMSFAILHAGQDAGINVVLLMTAYAQGGFNQPVEVKQQRFCDASVDAYLQRVDDLRRDGWAVGLAPHSVRAVPESWFRAIASYSQKNTLPLHVHADEQRAEIEQCQTAYGCTPIELLERFGVLSPQTTIIHATHASATELALLAKYGCTVCVCPTTEGDLGDGIAPYVELMAEDILLAIGSDSNTRFDPIEELRWAEYTARMRYQRRGVLVCENFSSSGPLLLDIGTHGGAIALGQSTGTISVGMLADMLAIDLKQSAMRGWTEDDLLDTLFFGASSNVIKQIWVQGRAISHT